MNKQNLSFYGFYGLRILQGAQSAGCAPHSIPPSVLNYLEPFLSGSGEKRQAVAQIPLDGIWLGAAGNSNTEYGYT